MNYNAYINLIAKDRLKEASEYKNLFIPDVLYKYYCLNENEEKNERIFDTLTEGKVYMSDLGGFNDPFEGKAFIFDEKELKEKGWNHELFVRFVEHINSNVGVGCFCNADEKEQNMPMWAYYANNHSGFCVEYLIDSKMKKFMYPISYDETRVLGDSLIGNIIDQTFDLIKEGKGIDDISWELNALNHMAYLSLTSKHKSWEHEKEIRALVPRSYGKYLNLVPKKIFVGINCKQEYTERLIEIAKKFQPFCEIFQMKNVANSLNHWLVKDKIFIR